MQGPLAPHRPPQFMSLGWDPGICRLPSDQMMLMQMLGITLWKRALHRLSRCCRGSCFHPTLPEVVVSLKHPQKGWIQEKHHRTLGRALNQVTSSEFTFWPCCWLVLSPWKSLNLPKLWFPHRKVGTRMSAYLRIFVRIQWGNPL